MKKKLVGNQEHLEERQYIYHKSGVPKAILVHILGKGDCPRCWQKQENHFTDNVNVYRIITN